MPDNIWRLLFFLCLLLLEKEINCLQCSGHNGLRLSSTLNAIEGGGSNVHIVDLMNDFLSLRMAFAQSHELSSSNQTVDLFKSIDLVMCPINNWQSIHRFNQCNEMLSKNVKQTASFTEWTQFCASYFDDKAHFQSYQFRLPLMSTVSAYFMYVNSEIILKRFSFYLKLLRFCVIYTQTLFIL